MLSELFNFSDYLADKYVKLRDLVHYPFAVHFGDCLGVCCRVLSGWLKRKFNRILFLDFFFYFFFWRLFQVIQSCLVNEAFLLPFGLNSTRFLEFLWCKIVFRVQYLFASTGFCCWIWFNKKLSIYFWLCFKLKVTISWLLRWNSSKNWLCRIIFICFQHLN